MVLDFELRVDDIQWLDIFFTAETINFTPVDDLDDLTKPVDPDAISQCPPNQNQRIKQRLL